MEVVHQVLTAKIFAVDGFMSMKQHPKGPEASPAILRKFSHHPKRMMEPHLLF